jgi:hypothetical protein
MILGIANIVSETVVAFSSSAGEQTVDRGLIVSGDQSKFEERLWKRADKLQVFTWVTCGDYEVSKAETISSNSSANVLTR